MSGLKSNPVIAGIVTFVGLVLLLMGTYSSSLGGLVVLVLEVFGLIVFIIGLIFVFGHVRRMLRGQ